MKAQILALILLSLTAGCSLLSPEPALEADVPDDERYLQAGPNTRVELGQDERTLLEDYKELNDTKIALETQLEEMQTENAQLREQLANAEKERDAFRNNLAGSGQEGERLASRVSELEAKVLSVHIEKNLVEQELMRLRIGSLRAQYESLVSAPAATPGTSR